MITSKPIITCGCDFPLFQIASSHTLSPDRKIISHTELLISDTFQVRQAMFVGCNSGMLRRLGRLLRADE